MSKVKKFEFYEECASQWYDRLNAADKSLMRELTQDIIKRPHKFLDVYTRNEYMARAARLATQNAVIPSESLYTLDNYIARTFYNATPALSIIAPVTIVNASKAQESKVYSGTDYGEAKLVGAHGSWNSPPMIGMAVSPAFIKALGVHAGYQLSFNEIDEAGLYDIEWYHALKCGEKVGYLTDEVLCLGEGAEHAEIDTTAVNGIHNYTSLQTANFGDGDNVITSQGDVRKGLFNALSSLLDVHEPGENILISTSGYHTETLLQMDSYGVTDFAVIKRDLFDPGYIKEWWIDSNIEADANATTTQRAMILRRGITTCKYEKVYPLQSKLMSDKQFPDDVKVMLMNMGIYKMYNANAGVICSGDITATTAGFAQNGRVL